MAGSPSASTSLARNAAPLGPAHARARPLPRHERRPHLSGRPRLATCHPDGRANGLTWIAPDGPRHTVLLAERVEERAVRLVRRSQDTRRPPPLHPEAPRQDRLRRQGRQGRRGRAHRLARGHRSAARVCVSALSIVDRFCSPPGGVLYMGVRSRESSALGGGAPPGPALAQRLEPPRASSACEFVSLEPCMKNRAEWFIAEVAVVPRGYGIVPLVPDERLRAIFDRCSVAAIGCESDGATTLARISSGHPRFACSWWSEIAASAHGMRASSRRFTRVCANVSRILQETLGSGTPSSADRSWCGRDKTRSKRRLWRSRAPRSLHQLTLLDEHVHE